MADDGPYAIEMYGGYVADVKLISGIIDGGLNEIDMATIEFVSRDRNLDLNEMVGAEIGFSIKGSDDKKQFFWGTCISGEYKGSPSGDGHYFAELRPCLWFLTRSTNNRIFQNKKTTDIVSEILGDYGFSNILKMNHSASEPEREYCVQYRETDLDFIKRIMEEDGIFFYFEYLEDSVKMVMSDNANTHPAVDVDDQFPFRDDEAEQQLDHIYKWEFKENAISGKVTLDDYNFETPKADLTATSEVPGGTFKHPSYEQYKYPGRYRVASRGDEFAKTQMEAEAASHRSWVGEGNIVNAWVGQTFDLIDHPRQDASGLNSFVVKKATQFFRLQAEGSNKIQSILEETYNFGLRQFEHTRIAFEAVLKEQPLRMPAVTPKPDIPGVHTAVVTGPKGEELHVDKYGRIKVQFHWDRDGKKDDKTTCWVRTMMPWTGKGWGMINLPRIGQEVVIQFEEGDPDRPLCVGMLYHAETMPPYDLPGNATRSGIKTNSSKGGGGYNELMFEDKAGEELIRFEAEKDYTQLVQNSAHTKVGYRHEKDTVKTAVNNPASGESGMAESMMLEVKKDLVEIIEEGNHYFEVTAGQQDIKVKKDKTEDIEGKFTETTNKDVTKTIKTGNLKETVKMGNVTRETKMGNEKNTLDMGNFTLKTSLGKIEMEAMQSIVLKVGTSKITVDQMGVKVEGMMLKFEGKAMTQIKAPMTQVNGDGMLILKGGLTLIN